MTVVVWWIITYYANGSASYRGERVALKNIRATARTGAKMRFVTLVFKGLGRSAIAYLGIPRETSRLPLPPRSVCLGSPLATCALPKGVCYLLTYYETSRLSSA